MLHLNLQVSTLLFGQSVSDMVKVAKEIRKRTRVREKILEQRGKDATMLPKALSSLTFCHDLPR
jgi:hypothetical protein